MKTNSLIRIALLFMIPATLHAQVPQLINYQGRITVDSTNFNGTGQFKFSLVDSSGSTTYWSNDETGISGNEPSGSIEVTVTKGLYSVLLGDESLTNMVGIQNTVFTNSEVYLRIWFTDGSNGFQLLSPDQRLAAVGYALIAAEAQTVANGSITSAKIANNAVGSTQLDSNLTLSGTTTGTFSGDGSGLTNITVGSSEPFVPEGWVLIPAATFIFGNTSDDDRDNDISNAVPFAIAGGNGAAFYIEAYEVDNYTWSNVYAYAVSNGYDTGGISIESEWELADPVSTDWYECIKWCNARSEQAGLTPAYYTDEALTSVFRTGTDLNVYMNWDSDGFRLPLEVEWEAAARGGLVGQRFPWGNVINQSMANYHSIGEASYDLGPYGYNTNGAPGAVHSGTFAPNGYGLFDMAGNLSEWCWDFYQETYEGGLWATSGSTHVVRGGSWDSSASECRVMFRTSAIPETVSIGFRTVRWPSE